jgi:DnaJ-class molecular chaperone
VAYATAAKVFARAAEQTVGLGIRRGQKLEQQISTAFFAVRCGPCGGSGKVKNDMPCEICKAEGALLLQGSVKEYRDCPNCGSSGFMGFDTHDVCIWCDGAGAIRMLD